MDAQLFGLKRCSDLCLVMLRVRHGFFCVIVLMQESLTGALALDQDIPQEGGIDPYTA